MRLTVLGGSAAGPNAGAGCSGYLIRDRETAIVIDLGPGTLPELKRHLEPRMLDAIVLSHAHLDHVLDLPALRYSLKYSPSPAWRPIPVWAPPGAVEVLDKLAQAFSTDDEAPAFYTGVLDIHPYDPAETLTIGSVSLRFAPGVHYVPSWGMRIASTDGSTLGYTADTGPAAEFAELFGGVRLLVSEATLLDPGSEPIETRGHLTAAEAGRLATRTGTPALLLSHLWEEFGFERLRE
jgi:ribonuclease BN (tRNA processing enzyme)